MAWKYLFGPVPSRRLGYSLGVDIVPRKICTLDCVYCQVGRTTEKTVERRSFVSVEDVLAEIEQWLGQGGNADYITLSGSGEPTLNADLGVFVARIKERTSIPVAVITNGTLMFREDVRSECGLADVVLPSLDAADTEAFEKINRPDSHIDIENVIEGLVAFRKEYDGPIWLEVFVVKGLNCDADSLTKLRLAIERINPEKVHLNTAVRPTVEKGIERLGLDELDAIAKSLGVKCEVVADFSKKRRDADEAGDETAADSIDRHCREILGMLARRPCSLEDIIAGLHLKPNEAVKYVSLLQQRGEIAEQDVSGTRYYQIESR